MPFEKKKFLMPLGNYAISKVTIFLLFSGRCPKVCSHTNLIFRDVKFYIFSISVLFVKRKADYTIEHQKCKDDEKRDLLIVSKMEFQRKKKQLTPFDPVFSNWASFIEKCQVLILSPSNFES